MRKILLIVASLLFFSTAYVSADYVETGPAPSGDNTLVTRGEKGSPLSQVDFDNNWDVLADKVTETHDDFLKPVKIDATVGDQAVHTVGSIGYYVNLYAGRQATLILEHDPANGATTSYTITSDFTVPDGFILKFDKGAIITIGAGVTFTIYSPAIVDAKLTQRIFSGTGTVDFTNGGEVCPDWWHSGTADYSVALGLAVDSLGSNDSTVVIKAGGRSLNESVIIPENINLKIDRGAILTIATAKTLTINGPLDAEEYQLFSGLGSVLFARDAIEKNYIEWFGGSVDGSAATNTTAIESALASMPYGGIIKLLAGEYEFNRFTIPVLGSTYVIGIHGMGKVETQLNFKEANPGVALTPAITVEGTLANRCIVDLRDFRMRGDDQTNLSGLFMDYAHQNSILERVWVSNFGGYGIHIGDGAAIEGFTLDNCRSTTNGTNLRLWGNSVVILGGVYTASIETNIYVKGSNISIIGANIEGAGTGYGIHAYYVNGLSIVNPYFEGTASDAIYLQGVVGASIDGFTTYAGDNAQNFINVKDSRGVAINGFGVRSVGTLANPIGIYWDTSSGVINAPSIANIDIGIKVVGTSQLVVIGPRFVSTTTPIETENNANVCLSVINMTRNEYNSSTLTGSSHIIQFTDQTVITSLTSMQKRANHNYDSGHADWELTEIETELKYIYAYTADAAVNAILPHSVQGYTYSIYNNSGYDLTFKVTGKTGGVIATGSQAVFVGLWDDVVKIYDSNSDSLTHDFGAGHADWTLTDLESTCKFISLTNADAAVNVVFPAAVADIHGNLISIYNNSGYTATIKASGGTGGIIANGENASFIVGWGDLYKIWEENDASLSISHDYAGAATDWALTASESKCEYISVSNANGAVNALLLAAGYLPGKTIAVYNGSGHALTFKVAGKTGASVANGKNALFIRGNDDVFEVWEEP